MLIHTPANLAQFYRDQRKQRGLSQTTVAHLASMRQDTVSKFEISSANVRLDTLFRLLDALDLELHLLPRGGDTQAADKPGWTEPW